MHHLPWLVALAALAGCAAPAQAADLMGCLLDASICEAGEECYDDRVFGHCFNPLQKRPGDMKQYRWFDKADVDLIEEYLTTLFQLGYYWDDPFMQCVIRVMLNGIQTQTYTKDFTACKALRGYPYTKEYTNEVGGANDLFEDRGENQPYEASIRFAPSSGQFADEVFYPSDATVAAAARTSNLNKLIMSMAGPARVRGDSEDEPLGHGLRQGLPGLPGLPAPQSKRDFAAKAPKQDGNRAMRKLMNVGNNAEQEGTLPFLDRRRFPPDRGPGRNDGEEDATALTELAMMVMEAERQAAEAQAEANEADDGEDDEDLHMFSAHYNTPTSFRQGLEYREPDAALPFLNEPLPEVVAVPRVVEAGDEPLLLEDVWDMQEAPEPGPWPRPEQPAPRGFSKLYNTPDSFRAGLETKDVEPGLGDQDDDGEGDGDIDPEVWMDSDVEPGGYQSPLAGGPVFIRPNRRGSADEEAPSSAGQPEQEEHLVQQEQQPVARQQPPPPPQQASEERAEEADQAMKELSHLLERYPADEKNSVPDEILAEEDAVDRAGPGALGRAYTEGGLVFLPDQQTDRPDALDTLEGRSLDALLKDWRGFERQERLDVKKPGPSYNVNNYYFQRGHDEEKRAGKAEVGEVKGEPRYEAIHASPPHKRPPYSDDMEATRSHNIVSVKFKNGVSTWADGDSLINVLAATLNQMPSAFGMRRITLNDAVSFKVNPATSTLNASEVARQIMENKEEIKKRTSVDIQSATAGRTVSKMPLVQSTPTVGWQSDALLLGSVVLGVTLSAAVISAVTYYAVQRVQRSREKLRGMAAPDTEASKDYQDLCRARMAKKAENEARPHPDPMHVDQRLASLSRESEGSNNSPSSRSSTSSWTEEPALTNMDISTGHMVLAYMEDHLKNKDRLEQEWQGLCAYEAEPCAATVAQKTENVKKNRYYPHVLPYDHSRVVLNELANATGSDYINASTITDHDPRNPAYLATQGPLPHTAADLWQLVWEQGSVVMVMLSRLTENGTAMCHRYWPEEGSELYHIYEVHLVSEHIWCDDYLVRSFYLKNLKTGETRTVTQFHFLSWPDHGVPPNTKPLLDFRRKVNKSYRGRSCPIVVHCSDGAGRTGTYCLIDMVLNRMAKGAKEIDIAATLEHIRDQRANMVESKEQFEFCLQAVADEVHAILKALPAQPTPPPTAVAPPPTSPEKEKEKEKEKAAKEPAKKKT